MHHPGDEGESLISSESFDSFAEAEIKIKQNREIGICDQNAHYSVAR